MPQKIESKSDELAVDIDTKPLIHDFKSDNISGATINERIGLELMRIGATILAPFEFIGFSLCAKLVRNIFRSKRSIRLKMDDDSYFEYPYGDGYWGVLLYNKKSYAPDIEPYLATFSDLPYIFIDCGSNYGYMSVLVSSRKYGSKTAIAIEADQNNFHRTVTNAELNGNRFEYRHNAVFSQSGETVVLGGSKHEARSISQNVPTGTMENVETLALNDLTGWLDSHDKQSPIVLKLDVEGVEIDAMKGADQLLERDCLIVYEEHGSDETHEVSRYMKDELGMRLFVGDENQVNMREIVDYVDLDNLKTNKRKGYDLFASVSELWIDRLQKLKSTSDKQAAS